MKQTTELFSNNDNKENNINIIINKRNKKPSIFKNNNKILGTRDLNRMENSCKKKIEEEEEPSSLMKQLLQRKQENLNNNTNNKFTNLLNNKENEIKLNKDLYFSQNYYDNFNIYLNEFNLNLNSKYNCQFKISNNINDYEKNGIHLNMRKILLNSLIELSNNFNLKDRTYQNAVEIMDYFIIKNQIEKEDYQLLAITSLILSSKFNDIIPIRIKDIEIDYPKENILKMEFEIMNLINFNYSRILKIDFLELYIYKLNLNQKQIHFIELLNEIIYEDIYFYKYDIRIIAISIIYFSCKIFKVDDIFIKKEDIIEFKLNEKILNFEFKLVNRCLIDIYRFYTIWKENSEKSFLFLKYNNENKSNISLLNIKKK